MSSRLWGDERVTANRLSMWSYLDAAFRYTGTTTFMVFTLFATQWSSSFPDGLHIGNAHQWAAHTAELRSAIEARTTVSAFFDSHNERRLTFRPRFLVFPACVCASNRLIDHLLAAFGLWSSSAPEVGAAMTGSSEHVLRDPLQRGILLTLGEKLMLALLGYQLLGRPNLKQKM